MMETKTLGERISQLRQNKGLTQKELGEQLNVSAQAVSKWENGLSEPDIDTIKKLCQVFGVSFAELVDGEEQIAVATAQAESAPPAIENTRIINGYCERCKNPVGPGEYVVQSGRGYQHIYCHDCAHKIEVEKRRSDCSSRLYDHKRETKRSVIFGPIAGVAVLAIMLLGLLLGEDPLETAPAVAISIIYGLCYFAFISQMFWDGVVQDLFFFFMKSFKMPGVIFTLDLDGLLFLIFVKLLFSFLSIFLSIIWFLIGVLFVMPIFSIVIYPFALIKHIHTGKKLKDEYEKANQAK